MIVPVIEHMEKMNSRTSTARLLNNLADKSTSLVNNSSSNHNETYSTCLNSNNLNSNSNTTALNGDNNIDINRNSNTNNNVSLISNQQQPLSSTSSLLIKDDINEERLRKNSVNQIEDVEMINDLNNSNNDLDYKTNDFNNNDKNLTSNLNQQAIIIEGGLNGLQFQLKPEINQNRRFTIKLVPISATSTTNLTTQLDDSNSVLKQNSLDTNHQTLILNGSTTQIGQESSNGLSNEVTYLEEKHSIVNDNTTSLNINSNSNQTTTVNLSDSNQSVYFMMQTPIDLLTNTIQTNPTIKLKTTPTQQKPLQQQTQIVTTPSSSPTTLKSFSPNQLQQSTLSTLTLQNIPLNSQTINTGFNSSILPNTTTVTLSSPISSTSSVNSSPTPPKIVRDERRRANHNEVERRRRDNINKWIVELSKVIPDCSNDQSKHGQSKGGILEKTVQYLIDMKKANQQLTDHIRNLEKLKPENELLKQQNENYKKENQLLRLKLGMDNLNGVETQQSNSLT